METDLEFTYDSGPLKIEKEETSVLPSMEELEQAFAALQDEAHDQKVEEFNEKMAELDEVKIDGAEELYFAAEPVAFTVPNTLHIWNDQGTLVEFDVDTGEVTFGEHFTMSETAKIFWECLGKSLNHPDPDALWAENTNLKKATVNFDEAMKVVD